MVIGKKNRTFAPEFMNLFMSDNTRTPLYVPTAPVADGAVGVEKSRVDDITKTAGYKEAMDDIKHGRVYHAESVDDMFKQILG